MKTFAIGLTATLAVLLPQTLSAQALNAASDSFANGDFASYEPNLENGEAVFLAANCASCHGVDGDPSILAGGQKIETKFGTLYSPNITTDTDHGIGNWSNDHFLNAVMLGQKPDGGMYYGAVFPFASYAYMRPEDALDMRGYMASLSTSDAASKPHEVNFANAWVLDGWTTAPVSLDMQNDPQLARGQYLVEALGYCAECHTPRLNGIGFKNDRDQDHAFEGESGLLGGYAPNITGRRLSTYPPEAFVTGALRQGLKLNGDPMTDPRMRRISAQMSGLPIKDRAAIYAYLTGAPLDISTLPPEPKDTSVEEAIEPVQVEDITGADALMGRVNAYCEAKGESSSDLANAPVPASNTDVSPALQAEVDGLVETHCRNCHGPGQTFQSAFFTGDLRDIARDPAVVLPGNPKASPLYESVASNRMPIRSKLTPSELQKVADWIEALANVPTPALPTTVQTAETETPILPRFAGGTLEEQVFSASQDLLGINELDRPFIRYMSFANIPLPEVDCNLEGALRNPMTYLHAGLNKFINSVSRENSLMQIQPVNDTDGALVRIDIRDYGWTTKDWQALTTAAYTAGSADAGFTPDAWADLAEAYPFAVAPNSQAILSTVSGMTSSAVPILRAEWFVRHASQSPYYDLLLRLPGDIRDLESRMRVNVDGAIQRGSVLRTGFVSGASGVSDFNRMLERHSLARDGYYWKSYDFGGDVGRHSLIQHPDGPALVPGLSSGTQGFEHDGGEMIFSLANGMQGYYLSTHEGRRLTVGPTSIVSFRTKPIGKGVEIVNARSCFDCHSNGIIAKRDQLRQFIETNSSFSLQQRDALLNMYRPQEEVDAAFSTDAGRFIASLHELGATEPSPDGRPVSLRAPASAGGGEIVTYLADLYFENLGEEQVAREFFMDSETFSKRIKGIADPELRQVADTWKQRLDAGLFVTRAEVAEHWANMLPRITRMSALDSQEAPISENYSGSAETLVSALSQATYSDQQVFVPADNSFRPLTVPEPTAGQALTLSLSVPKVNTQVGDLLVFDVSSNRRCELQILYVEEGNTVEDLPQEILGARFLEAGEVRRIPDPTSGLVLRFTSPGKGETMLAFCREDGLGEQRINAADAIRKAQDRYQPLTKGLSIEVVSQVEKSAGTSALNAVTFNVTP
ncbi:c-type cytochrome [Parasedimentitalea maritima]|uniref:C-type cytochrome n=1 Tax=Parasedimentitalea maritima TaxID=2578117 RepID=A0ABY2V1H2_9RHOB|nr:c-type cytochrome [Zongyanglinia marina]TLP69384.1 c-type cytochrome [Zongyanglinia marina]